MESIPDLTAAILVAGTASSANALRALENCPAAICLASLSGELLYLNLKAETIFGVVHGGDINGRHISDLFSEKSQLANLEAVARDGVERQFEILREVENLGRRHLLCKLTRVPEKNGIPTWLAFVVLDDDHGSAADDADIDDAETLRIVRHLGGIAVWKVRVQDGQEWSPNLMQWSREVRPLVNLKCDLEDLTLRDYFDLVPVEDRRGMLAALQKPQGDGSAYEAVYGLRSKNSDPKMILSRATLVREQSSDAPQELWGMEQDVSAAFSDLALHNKASLLDTVAAAVDGPIYAVDRDCRLIYFNDFVRDVMRAVYGVDAEIGMRAFDFPDHAARRKTWMANFRRAIGGVRVVEKISLPCDQTTAQYFEITYAPIMSESAVTGVGVFGVRVASPQASKPLRSVNSRSLA